MIQWINAAEVGRVLGFAPRTVCERLAKRPDFPKPMVLGRPRWRRDEIERWAERIRKEAA